MASRFQQALDALPPLKRLGDVSIRYEPSLLIGEADRPRAGWAPVVALCVGVGGAVGLLAAGLSGADAGALAVAVLATGLGFGGAAWLNQRERRQRRFVLNFGTYALRLDFSTPIAGRPKTLVLHFDLVRSVDVREQGDGALCLTVDFMPAAQSSELLREVLVAHVSPDARPQLERLARVLHDAFDLARLEQPAEEGGLTADTAPSRSS